MCSTSEAHEACDRLHQCRTMSVHYILGFGMFAGRTPVKTQNATGGVCPRVRPCMARSDVRVTRHLPHRISSPILGSDRLHHCGTMCVHYMLDLGMHAGRTAAKRTKCHLWGLAQGQSM